MKIKGMSFCFMCVIFILFSQNVKSASVCDLDTLKMELQEDLADNDMLDCLRFIPVPHSVKETEVVKNKRIAAFWDTSCSFEADSTMFETLMKNYGVTTLVDSEGEPVKEDFEDQADMCELIRAVIAKNLFDIPNLDMRKIPHDVVENVQCAGPKSDKRGPQICAATSGSFKNAGAWNVMNKSSAMQFNNKPQFIEADPESTAPNSPFTVQKDTPESVSDLNMLSKEQLDNNGGEISNLINAAIAGKKALKKRDEEVEGGLADGDTNKGKTENIHHYFKRLPKCTFAKDDAFRLVEGGQLNFKVDGMKIMMGIYMASVEFNAFAEICLKFNVNDREIEASRQCIGGDLRQTSLSTAYAGKVSAKEKTLSLLNKCTVPGKVVSDGESMNMTFGAITLPDQGYYKSNATTNGIKVAVTNSAFVVMENFDLNIIHQGESPAYYMIIVNFSAPFIGSTSFGTVLTLNGEEINDTALKRGPINTVSINTTTVLQLVPGSNAIGVNYLLDNPNDSKYETTINSSENSPKYIQEITAFKLTDGTIVNSFKPKAAVPLTSSSNGGWSSFNIDAKLELQSETHIMILYHLCLFVNGKSFTARLRVNGNQSFKSTVARIVDEENASIQGYFVKKLPAGTYDFDLEFLTTAEGNFDPSSEQVDKQNVSIKIIQFDE